MEMDVWVYVDLAGASTLVGRLWARSRGARESASFEYDQSWLSHEERFALEPALSLGPGPFHTAGDKVIFGAIGDSAPDRWGRTLMRRAERQRARQEGEMPRTLGEIDFLLRVDDEARQGALRFSKSQGGPFLAESGGMRIPPLVELPRLLSAADKIADESDTAEELRLLLAPGSSLGGARPKASVRDHDGHLLIAKFAHRDDEIDVVRWEAVALGLARNGGLVVPDWRIEKVGDFPVLLLRRFDRDKNSRIPFLSAMSMLDARDNERRSYLEMVDALRRYGAVPVADMHALWRRIVFNILISNTDDHLRNHGFLYEGTNGWRLSPAYDLNPVPTDLKPRILSTNIDLDDGTASIELAFSVAAYFELNQTEARQVAREVAVAVTGWQHEASSVGIPKSQIKRMESAFEHADLRAALEVK
ncbi:MAG: phosphatidylinositol kinase [Planctomyces sp.]|nr:phosphatidylinositol kinase [Planctomyces sp.]